MVDGSTRRAASALVVFVGPLIVAACDYNDPDLGSGENIRVDFDQGRDLRATGEVFISEETATRPAAVYLSIYATPDRDHEEGWGLQALVSLDDVAYADEIVLTIVPPDPVDAYAALLPGQVLVGPTERGTLGYPDYASEGTVRLRLDDCLPYIGGSVETPSSSLQAGFAGTVRRFKPFDETLCDRQ